MSASSTTCATVPATAPGGRVVDHRGLVGRAGGGDLHRVAGARASRAIAVPDLPAPMISITGVVLTPISGWVLMPSCAA